MSVVAKPVVERIADVVYQRLLQLTGGVSSYITISDVVRYDRRDAYTPADRQVVLTQGSNERVPELDHEGNPPAVCRQQTFNLRCHVIPSELDDTPTDTLVNLMVMAVMAAITDDQATWHNFDGLAIDAEFGSTEQIDDDGTGIDGANLPLLVRYRTDENNPWNVRA